MSLPVFDKSVLEGVNPRGRVDVAVSAGLGLLARRDPRLSAAHEALKPVLDLGLLYFLGPEKEFRKVFRSLATPKQAKQIRARRIKSKRKGILPENKSSKRARPSRVIYDAEVVSL